MMALHGRLLAYVVAILPVLWGGPVQAQPMTFQDCEFWRSDGAIERETDVVLSHFVMLFEPIKLKVRWFNARTGLVDKEETEITVETIDNPDGHPSEPLYLSVEDAPRHPEVFRLPRHVVVRVKGAAVPSRQQLFVQNLPAKSFTKAGASESSYCVAVPGSNHLTAKRGVMPGTPPERLEFKDGPPLVPLTPVDPVVPSLSDLADRTTAGKPPPPPPVPSLTELTTTPTPFEPTFRPPQAPRPPAETGKKVGGGPVAVCMPGETAPETLTFSGDALPEGFLIGRRGSARSVASVTYNEILGTVIRNDDSVLPVSASGTIEPLEVIRSSRDGAGLLTLLAMVRGKVEGAPLAEPVLSVRVFGDPAAVRMSGLQRLDRDPVLSGLIAADGLAAEWSSVGPDGRLAAPRRFATFGDLVAAAEAEPAGEANYSARAVLQRFFDGFAATLIGSGTTTDAAIWVLQGVLMPDETPAMLTAMIESVNQDGNIRRFAPPQSEPRRWLHVLSGTFAQRFSEAYLTGPIERSAPAIGNFSIELDPGREPRDFLRGDDRLALMLQNHARRNAPADLLPAAAPPEGTATSVVAAETHDLVGIAIRKDQTSRLVRDLANAKRSLMDLQSGVTPASSGDGEGFNPFSLFLPSSGPDGTIRGLFAPVSAIDTRLALSHREGRSAEILAFVERLLNNVSYAAALAEEGCDAIVVVAD